MVRIPPCAIFFQITRIDHLWAPLESEPPSTTRGTVTCSTNAHAALDLWGTAKTARPIASTRSRLTQSPRAQTWSVLRQYLRLLNQYMVNIRKYNEEFAAHSGDILVYSPLPSLPGQSQTTGIAVDTLQDFSVPWAVQNKVCTCTFEGPSASNDTHATGYILCISKASFRSHTEDQLHGATRLIATKTYLIPDTALSTREAYGIKLCMYTRSLHLTHAFRGAVYQ